MTQSLVFANATAACPEALVEKAAVVCENGLITDVGRADKVEVSATAFQVDAGGGYVAPGFVDIHCHGGDGADFMDGTVAAVRTAIAAHARHGTTTIFPTTATGSPAQLRAMFDACGEVRNDWRPRDGARVARIHLYGPFFAEEKIGCHPAPGRRDPEPAEYGSYFDTGLVAIATSAAELPGAIEYCGCVSSRIRVERSICRPAGIASDRPMTVNGSSPTGKLGFRPIGSQAQ